MKYFCLLFSNVIGFLPISMFSVVRLVMKGKIGYSLMVSLTTHSMYLISFTSAIVVGASLPFKTLLASSATFSYGNDH